MQRHWPRPLPTLHTMQCDVNGNAVRSWSMRAQAQSLLLHAKKFGNLSVLHHIANKFAHASGWNSAGSVGCFAARLLVARQHSANLQPDASADWLAISAERTSLTKAWTRTCILCFHAAPLTRASSNPAHHESPVSGEVLQQQQQPADWRICECVHAAERAASC